MDSKKSDALLDAYGRLLRATMVLHYEADTDLDYDAWVEMAEVRYDDHLIAFDKAEPDIPERICPEARCVAPYVPDSEPYRFGRDHDGNEVWMQRWMCEGKPRHWHTVEVPKP